MPPARRRRAPAQDESEGSDAEAEPQTQRRRTLQDADDDEDFAGTGAAPTQDTNLEQMSKNLVRLALACEYSRTPIRRADITTKVLGTQSRQFKPVFADAQNKLRAIFGMEMTELPLREKVTLAQRRAAQKSQSTQKSSGAWVLTSVLPERFRTADIIPPGQVPTTEMESQYTGLYTFVVSLILLSGGTLQDNRLERYLRRVNIEDVASANSYNIMAGSDKTEKLLKRMEKDGYVVKVRDNSSGEETIEWVVGPRGKTEVGQEGVKGMVRTVYGEEGNTTELNRRMDRSLGVSETRLRQPDQQASQKKRGRPRRDEEEEEEEEEEEDESSEDG